MEWALCGLEGPAGELSCVLECLRSSGSSFVVRYRVSSRVEGRLVTRSSPEWKSICTMERCKIDSKELRNHIRCEWLWSGQIGNVFRWCE